MPQALIDFLERGGPTLWLIAALSVVMLALILWKIWRLARMGAWSGAATSVDNPLTIAEFHMYQDELNELGHVLQTAANPALAWHNNKQRMHQLEVLLCC